LIFFAHFSKSYNDDDEGRDQEGQKRKHKIPTMGSYQLLIPNKRIFLCCQKIA
jgi:hypothetical protein